MCVEILFGGINFPFMCEFLTGSGRSFSAGLDISAFADIRKRTIAPIKQIFCRDRHFTVSLHTYYANIDIQNLYVSNSGAAKGSLHID